MGLKSWITNDPQDMFGNTNEGAKAKSKTPKREVVAMPKPEDIINEDAGKNKMILFEPRAYSETLDIADQLKARNTVVVNLKRVTSDQAEKIIDFISGTIYAIEGGIQKIGPGIFLCTPDNVNVQGSITEESAGKGIYDNDDITLGI